MKCASGERRISELEADLALFTEEAVSLRDYVKLLEEKVVKLTNLKHQVELDEHRLTQAQQRIKVNFIIHLILLLPENVAENSWVLYNLCKARVFFLWWEDNAQEPFFFSLTLKVGICIKFCIFLNLMHTIVPD